VAVFLISALRAIVEMLGLCLLGQGILYVLAGRQRASNRVYQLFSLITEAPRQITASVLPRTTSQVAIGILTFVIVLIIWLVLAFVRKFV
jgi:hypothetical protein